MLNAHGPGSVQYEITHNLPYDQTTTKETLTKVTNINGTSDNTCKCSSWLEHWKKYGGGSELPKWCAEKGCVQKPEAGAHVQMDSTADRGWYIVPLCSKHNAETGKSLDVSDSTKLVSANVSETCGKK